MEWIGKCCSTRRSTAAALVAAHLMEHYKACSSSRGIRVAESLDAAAATSNSNCVQPQLDPNIVAAAGELQQVIKDLGDPGRKAQQAEIKSPGAVVVVRVLQHQQLLCRNPLDILKLR
ncbi:unnamed protein product [Sphagnum balticum]